MSVNEFVPPGFLEVIIDDDKMLQDVRKKVMQKVDPNDDEKLEFNEFQKVIGPVMTPQQETYRPVSKFPLFSELNFSNFFGLNKIFKVEKVKFITSRSRLSISSG